MTSSPLLLSLSKTASLPALSVSPCVTLYLPKAPFLFIVAKPCGLVAKGVVAKQFILHQGLLGRFLFQLLQLQYAGDLLCFNHVMLLYCKPTHKAEHGNMAQGLVAGEWEEKVGPGEGDVKRS